VVLETGLPGRDRGARGVRAASRWYAYRNRTSIRSSRPRISDGVIRDGRKADKYGWCAYVAVQAWTRVVSSVMVHINLTVIRWQARHSERPVVIPHKGAARIRQASQLRPGVFVCLVHSSVDD